MLTVPDLREDDVSLSLIKKYKIASVFLPSYKNLEEQEILLEDKPKKDVFF